MKDIISYGIEVKKELDLDNLNINKIKLEKSGISEINKQLEYCNKKLVIKKELSKTNLPRSWKDDYIINLLKKGISTKFIKEKSSILLKIFIDSAITTKGLGYNKYVLFFYLNNKIYIIHTTKLHSLGSTNKNKNNCSITRILDHDNLLRIICFEKNKENKVIVSAWEKTKSKTFLKFLGIELNNFENFGEIIFHLEDKNSFLTGFKYEVDPNQLINHIFNKKIIFKETKNIIKLEKNEFKINKILIKGELGRDEIKLNKLLSSLLDDYVGLAQKSKELIKNYRNNLLNIKIIDFEDYLLYDDKKITKYNEKYKDLFLIYSFKDEYKEIDLSEDFIIKFIQIFRKCLNNNENIKILHVLDDYVLNQETIIKPFVFYNLLKKDGIKKINETINILIKEHNNNNHDTIKDIFEIIIIDLFIKLTENLNLNYFFKNIKIKLIKEFEKNNSNNIFFSKENNFLEYKRGEFLKGKEKDIIKRISKCITKKTKSKNNPFIILIGVDEETREIMLTSRNINDNFITKIKNEVNISLLNKSNHQIENIFDFRNIIPKKHLLMIHTIKSDKNDK